MVKPPARLKDIAKHTGFSVNTVSLALRSSPRIPAQTRKQIVDAAEELNYLPDELAKSLVLRETKSIGLIMTDLTNPVLTAMSQAVELELTKRGYTTLFATSNNELDLEQKLMAAFRARRVDGILIFPSQHMQIDHIRTLRERNFPVVLLVGDAESGVDAVCMDERAGAYKATNHLLKSGHSKIAFFDGAGRNGNFEKLEGYTAALEAAGLSFDAKLNINPCGSDVASGYAAMDALYQKNTGATAMLAATDSLALGALRYCIKHQISVPQEMAIFGFDNIEFAEHAVISLSSVDYDIGAVSRMAIDRVIALINCKGDLPAPEVTLVEPDIIIRESTN